jgi:hypothetical protein
VILGREQSSSGQRENFSRHGMRENLSISNPTRHTIASASKAIRKSSEEPIAVAASAIEPLDVSNSLASSLASSFQQLEIDEDKLISRRPTPTLIFNQTQQSRTMSNNTLAMTFSGENYKPVMVVMYIDSVEVIAENSGQDTAGKARIYRVMFYNGLQEKAKDWFDNLEMNIQID